MRDLHLLQNLVDATLDLFLGPLHLQRSESYFVKHRRVEQLDVGVLKHQRHPAPEVELNFSHEAVLGQGLTLEDNAPLLHKAKTVKDTEQGRFSGTVRPQQGDSL